jgi:hypothetical protein
MRQSREVWRCASCDEVTTYPSGQVRKCACEREQEAEWAQWERDNEIATPSRMADHFASDR